jgi:hypothetical protein
LTLLASATQGDGSLFDLYRVLHFVLPPVLALGAAEIQGHALLRAGREVNGILDVATRALRILGAWQGRVCRQIR